jgi:hypothetical protein
MGLAFSQDRFFPECHEAIGTSIVRENGMTDAWILNSCWKSFKGTYIEHNMPEAGPYTPARDRALAAALRRTANAELAFPQPRMNGPQAY